MYLIGSNQINHNPFLNCKGTLPLKIRIISYAFNTNERKSNHDVNNIVLGLKVYKIFISYISLLMLNNDVSLSAKFFKTIWNL